MTVEKAKNVPPFVLWCTATIPTAFDDSMSYYEALCALYKFIQDHMVEPINNNATILEKTIEEMAELKEYVDNYFKNLDVQEEINNKLDEMAEDGSLAELVAVYLEGKVDYYEITDQSVADVQEIFDVERPKVISFLNDYTFNTTMHLNSNTKILLNNHTITFDIPSVIDDYQHCHGFFNFKYNEEPTLYNGKGNITIVGGKIVGGNLSFCHASNINIISVDFVNCKNNHILEMCAIKNLNVEDCSFAGIPYGSTGEYIQNDSAVYASFPWFDENSQTYDGTTCNSINIKNCIFKTSTDLNYIFDSGVGTHAGQSGDLYSSKGVNITNCKFINPTSASVQFYNVNGLIIDGCEFKGVNASESSVHIRLRSGVVNTAIKNSSFVGMTRAIEFSSQHLDTKSVNIVDNTFEGYTNSTYPSYSIITLWNPISINIHNNLFRDFIQKCIVISKDGSTYDSNVKYETSIRGNVFTPLHNIDNGCVDISCGNAYVSGNTFNCEGITVGSTRLIGVGSDAGSVYSSGNDVPFSLYGSSKDIYDKPYNALTGTGGFKHIYNSPKQLWSGNSTSETIAPTEYLIPTNFNTMMLTIGTGTNTQTLVLKDFVSNDYLTARTWLFPVVGTDSAVSVASMTLDNSNNLIYSSDVPLRNVKLINE